MGYVFRDDGRERLLARTEGKTILKKLRIQEHGTLYFF